MPVLPNYLPGRDPTRSFAEAAGAIEGLMSRAQERRQEAKSFDNRQTVFRQQQEDREFLEPVFRAKAAADAATAAEQFSTAQHRQQMREFAAASRIEAQQRFHDLTNIDAVYADPSPEGRAMNTERRMEALTNWMQDFGGLAPFDEEIANTSKIIESELKQIIGAREFVREQQIRNQIDETEKARTRNERIALQLESIQAAHGPEAKFGVPIAMPGNAGKALLYSPGVDQPQVIDTQDRLNEPVLDQVQIGEKTYFRDRIGGTVRYFDEKGEPVQFGSTDPLMQAIASKLGATAPAGESAATAPAKPQATKIDQPFTSRAEFQKFATENGLTGRLEVVIDGKPVVVTIAP